ncbi:hypothetical protein [Streptococcus suis]|uniref:hypothetical protein n=1 Tax=Streptococcus suis TaxID=1307 RepID=UPI0015D49FD1|nr:hypothetical protein [Streptococcus suis]
MKAGDSANQVRHKKSRTACKVSHIREVQLSIMTTRQTGGLNKGYKPTSPASA